MRPGDRVFIAWISKASGAPEVLERRIVTPGPEVTYLDEALDATKRLRVAPTRMLHATRAAALQDLEERLRKRAEQERRIATDSNLRADRCLEQAEHARKLAEAAR